MLNEQEIEILVDALNMALASNKRMQTSKPKFKEIFDKIEVDINLVKNKIQAQLIEKPRKEK